MAFTVREPVTTGEYVPCFFPLQLTSVCVCVCVCVCVYVCVCVCMCVCVCVCRYLCCTYNTWFCKKVGLQICVHVLILLSVPLLKATDIHFQLAECSNGRWPVSL